MLVTIDNNANRDVNDLFIPNIFEFLAASNAKVRLVCEVPELLELKPNVVPTSTKY
jgi:hypothetical protein